MHACTLAHPVVSLSWTRLVGAKSQAKAVTPKLAAIDTSENLLNCADFSSLRCINLFVLDQLHRLCCVRSEQKVRSMNWHFRVCRRCKRAPDVEVNGGCGPADSPSAEVSG
eukprot:3023015-Pleurochrysis_carterae.AAC.1